MLNEVAVFFSTSLSILAAEVANNADPSILTDLTEQVEEASGTAEATASTVQGLYHLLFGAVVVFSIIAMVFSAIALILILRHKLENRGDSDREGNSKWNQINEQKLKDIYIQIDRINDKVDKLSEFDSDRIKELSNGIKVWQKKMERKYCSQPPSIYTEQETESRKSSGPDVFSTGKYLVAGRNVTGGREFRLAEEPGRFPFILYSDNTVGIDMEHCADQCYPINGFAEEGLSDLFQITVDGCKLTEADINTRNEYCTFEQMKELAQIEIGERENRVKVICKGNVLLKKISC